MRERMWKVYVTGDPSKPNNNKRPLLWASFRLNIYAEQFAARLREEHPTWTVRVK